MKWTDRGLELYFSDEIIHLAPLTVTRFFAVLLVFGLVAYIYRSSIGWMNRGPCRWRRVRQKGQTSFTLWTCNNCTAEAYTTDKRAPKECKQALKSTL